MSNDTSGIGTTVTVAMSPDSIGVSTDATTQASLSEPMTSQTDQTQTPDNIGLIAAVISVVIVLLGTIVVLVVIVLLVKKRY